MWIQNIFVEAFVIATGLYCVERHCSGLHCTECMAQCTNFFFFTLSLSLRTIHRHMQRTPRGDNVFCVPSLCHDWIQPKTRDAKPAHQGSSNLNVTQIHFFMSLQKGEIDFCNFYTRKVFIMTWLTGIYGREECLINTCSVWPLGTLTSLN